jgi:hypothetical protein
VNFTLCSLDDCGMIGSFVFGTMCVSSAHHGLAIRADHLRRSITDIKNAWRCILHIFFPYLPDVARLIESNTVSFISPLMEAARRIQLAHNAVFIVNRCSSSMHQEIAKLIIYAILECCSYSLTEYTSCHTQFLLLLSCSRLHPRR